MNAVQQAPYIPDTAPFSAEQRAWLNGFFAALYCRADVPSQLNLNDLPNATAASPRTATALTILYGSQTGTAEGVARDAASLAEAQGFAPRVFDMDDYDATHLPTAERLLIVTSTYGDGEMPDNAQAFWAALCADDAPRLEKTQFSVLALGDTNYETFCEAGKQFDERLAALGARRIHPRVDCDVDFEAPFQSWIEGVLPALGTAGEGAGKADVRLAVVDKAPAKPAFNRNNPFTARLIANTVLTQAESSKETRHYALSLADSGIEYEAGDALAVIPRNCPALVQDTLAALGLNGEEPVASAYNGQVPLQQALLEDYEIRLPAKELLAAIAERSEDAEFAALLEDKDRLNAYLWGREMVDLLKAFPKARFTADEFVGLLKKLQHRAYSIASSSKQHPDEVHLTVASVRYESHARARKGVCSTFLADRAGEGGEVRVFLTPNKNFGVPADDNCPMIMVGPGTGVAPFRAFLQERKMRGAMGKNWLFFGERNRACDYFYANELEDYRASGLLTRLDLAFSRDQAEKVYVQQRMRENAGELYAWLEEGGYFFVCGDAYRMAKDVDAALHEIIMTAGGMNTDAAAAYVNRLKKEKRYLRDVY